MNEEEEIDREEDGRKGKNDRSDDWEWKGGEEEERMGIGEGRE